MLRQVSTLRSLAACLDDGRLYLRYLGRRIPGHRRYQEAVRGKVGLEIGGPSKLFRSRLPLYPVVASLDGANFASRTLWEGQIGVGRLFRYFRRRVGFQFIADATDLRALRSESYDFILSSNCLEHIANPIRALEEWWRVLKPRGMLVLVVPNRKHNFDHRRPVTPFEHVISDHQRRVEESDLTHLEEILDLHDLSLDPAAGSFEDFRARSLDNLAYRALHHHVFDLGLVQDVLEYSRFEIAAQCETRRDYFALGRKRE